MTSESNLRTIVLFIAIIVFSVAFYFSYLKFEQFLKIKAVTECGQISKYETTDESDNKVSYPVKDIYDSCLKNSGF